MEFVPCSVWNKRRRYDFDGHLLATASSQRPHVARWAELCLYALPPNTHANYVFSRVGYSRVYHQEQCPEVTHHLPFGHELSYTPVATEIIPCGSCAPIRPRQITDLDFLTTHRFELTRPFAAICTDADAVVATLAEPKRRAPAHPAGPITLPWLSEQLLSDAAALDPALAAAYAIDLTPRRTTNERSEQSLRARR